MNGLREKNLDRGLRAVVSGGEHYTTAPTEQRRAWVARRHGFARADRPPYCRLSTASRLHGGSVRASRASRSQAPYLADLCLNGLIAKKLRHRRFTREPLHKPPTLRLENLRARTRSARWGLRGVALFCCSGFCAKERVPFPRAWPPRARNPGFLTPCSRPRMPNPLVQRLPRCGRGIFSAVELG